MIRAVVGKQVKYKNVVSVEEKSKLENVTVYPNPSNDYINVSDVVNFINLNLEYNRSYECDLGCSFSIKINDIYYFIKSALQDTAIKRLKKYKSGFVAKKINLKKINWKPIVSMEKGILELLK